MIKKQITSQEQSKIWLGRYKYFCQTVKFCVILTVINKFNKEIQANTRQKNKIQQEGENEEKQDRKKKNLIKSKKEINCLDIFCGNGPDLIKLGFHCKNYMGVDYIQEFLDTLLYDRARTFQQFDDFLMHINVQNIDLAEHQMLNQLKLKMDFKPNLINIQFGIHHAFGSNENLSKLMDFIENNSVKNDKYVILSYMDGKKVKQLLQDTGVYTQKGYSIERKYDKKDYNEQKFGMKILFKIEDQKFYEQDEYLVFDDLLLKEFQRRKYVLFFKGDFTWTGWNFELFAEMHPLFGDTRYRRFKQFLDSNDKFGYKQLASLFEYMVVYKK